MPNPHPTWKVLLIGGPSGVGKSIVAEQIGVRLGIPWLQVGDLRLALLASRATLPEGAPNPFFFDETPDAWRLPTEQFRDGLIGVGEALTPAIEKVLDNHVVIDAPLIIEGDGILPALLARPIVRAHADNDRVRAVFVTEPDEAAILSNIRARGRGVHDRPDAELRTEARAKWLYGLWLAAEARRHRLPVLESRPWDTLAERVLAATEAPT